MNVEIGNKAVQFLFWIYMFRIFGTVHGPDKIQLRYIQII